MESLKGITTPVYAWVREYSHTDLRHWLQILTVVSVNLEDLEKPRREDVNLVLIRKLPLDSEDPLYDRNWDGKTRSFLGATWDEATPDKLRISTRAAARARDVETYAEMDAKSKKQIPLVIEMVCP